MQGLSGTLGHPFPSFRKKKNLYFVFFLKPPELHTHTQKKQIGEVKWLLKLLFVFSWQQCERERDIILLHLLRIIRRVLFGSLGNMGSTSAVATPAATCRPHANKPTETIINKRRSLDDYYTFLSDNNGEQNMSLRDKQSWPTEITSHKKKGKNESLPGKFIGPGESADIVWRLIRFNVPFRNKTHKSFVLDAVGSAKERRVLTWLTRTRITVRSRLPRSFGTEPTHFFRPPPLRSAPRIAADNWNVDTTREKEFKIAVGNSENTKKKKRKWEKKITGRMSTGKGI